MPNPFSDTMTLRVGLPKASELNIELFDVAGRRVRSEHTPSLAAGFPAWIVVVPLKAVRSY